MKSNTQYASMSAQSSTFGFHTFSERIKLAPEQNARITCIGELSAKVLQKVSTLLGEVFESEDTKFPWLQKLMLGSIPKEHHGFARELQMAVGNHCPVNLFRADVVGGGRIAELQCPGSGWAYTRILENHYGIKPEDSPLLAAIKDWTNGERTSWWLHDEKHERSVRFLVEECHKIGVEIEVFTEDTFIADSALQVIKRPPLPELIAHPEGRRLLERWRAGKVRMDLLPSMIPETKYLMAILWHPAFADLFTEEERNLCPRTTLIMSRNQEVRLGEDSERAIAVDQLFERHPRDFILKYGGAQKDLRGGCHAVYKLDTGGVKLSDRMELFERALVDWKNGEGWILQKFFPEFWPIARTLGRKPLQYNAIFRPHFYRNRDGQVVQVANTLTACPNWKVHAQSYAYLGLCV